MAQAKLTGQSVQKTRRIPDSSANNAFSSVRLNGIDAEGA
jgi:hypothetical protein